MKDFDKWNKIKKQIEITEKKVFSNIREIWWCSIGENVGTEFCGKNDLYERPVLVLKIYNVDTIKILPLTSKVKEGKYFVPVTYGEVTSYGSLSQVKTISSKRLSRKVGKITSEEFKKIMEAYKDSF
jgi:mRNA-degrading endonuclease toxin of MazEF toxin-antitoxin module